MGSVCGDMCKYLHTHITKTMVGANEQFCDNSVWNYGKAVTARSFSKVVRKGK